VTLNKALYLATEILDAQVANDAHMEAELLLCHILGISKTQLYSQPERMLTQVEIDSLQHLVQRRSLHEPVAYILKNCEFYGIDFYLDQRTFIPRPETELMVEKIIEFTQQRFSSGNFTIADVGTGSGAIAISLALALSQAKVYAMDISALALQVAAINCQHHKLGSQVELLQGDLLEPLPQTVDVIAANLPYIEDCELFALSPEIINFEPMIALAGGKDGLDSIRSLLAQIPGKIKPRGAFFMEIGQGQDKAVASLINSYFPQASLELIPDLNKINRVVKVTL
jgi:release factor glutamine methyltransferase